MRQYDSNNFNEIDQNLGKAIVEEVEADGAFKIFTLMGDKHSSGGKDRTGY